MNLVGRRQFWLVILMATMMISSLYPQPWNLMMPKTRSYV